MDEAQRIVRLATLERRRRRYFDDESASDEPRLDPSEVELYVGRYLADHGMGNHVEIRWGAAAGGYVQPAMVTTTSPSKGASGVLHLPPQASAWTEGSLANLLNHEVGTHFVRSANEQQWCEYRQMFGGAYRRTGAKSAGGSDKHVTMRELVSTEEGLATLNTLLESKACMRRSGQRRGWHASGRTPGCAGQAACVGGALVRCGGARAVDGVHAAVLRAKGKSPPCPFPASESPLPAP